MITFLFVSLIISAILTVIFGIGVFITDSKVCFILSIVNFVIFIVSLIGFVCCEEKSRDFKTIVQTKEMPVIDTIVLTKNNVADTTYLYKFR